MNVEELSALNLRFVDLSNRFKAAWAFHQFLQALSKIFAERRSTADPIPFQRIYGELKVVTKTLHSGATEGLAKNLDLIAETLEARYRQLVEVDEGISPSEFRQFFDRLDPFDERVLVQLVRFYILARCGNQLSDDSLDKVDFLATRLGERLLELDRPAIERDQRRFREVSSGLWLSTAQPEPTPQKLASIAAAVDEVREALATARGIEEFHDSGIINRYRTVKHGLGWLFFHPEVLVAVVETNLRLRALIGGWYASEEKRIVDECREVLDLGREGEVPNQLDGELRSFQGEVEELERKIEEHNVKLHDLRDLRNRARSLRPRLRAGSGDVESTGTLTFPVAAAAPAEHPAFSLLTPQLSAPVPESLVDSSGLHDTGEIPIQELQPQSPSIPPLRVRSKHADLVGVPLSRILGQLEQLDPRQAPRLAVHEPALAALRLEAREVVAHRRLVEGYRCDRAREQLVLEAAALRLEIVALAEMMLAIAADNRDEVDGKVARGRALCRLADDFAIGLQRAMEESVLEEDSEEARSMFVLRQRMVREGSGLWLLVYRRDH